MIRRQNYVGDLDLGEILGAPIVIAILVLMAFYGALLAIGAFQWNEGQVEVYNQKAEIFNNWPEEERQLVKDLLDATGALKDDLKLPPKDPPIDVGKIARSRWAGFVIILDLWVMCLHVTLRYTFKRNEQFYWADLPLEKWEGKVLLAFILPACGPFWLIKRRKLRKIRWAELAEKEECEEIDRLISEDWLLEEKQTEVKLGEQAKKRYVEMRIMNQEKIRADKERDLNSRINSDKSMLRDYGRKIAEYQQFVGKAQAELRDLQSQEMSAGASRAEAKLEWEQILKMRGVSSINIKTDAKTRGKVIEILIKVRVPYKGALYDFGDYLVTFGTDGMRNERVRSGVCKNADNHRPYYPSGRGFCFGNRLSDIDRYTRAGRIVEALTLVVDSLHAVNDGDWEDIPGCYRKVETVKQRAKRLKWQGVFQGR